MESRFKRVCFSKVAACGKKLAARGPAFRLFSDVRGAYQGVFQTDRPSVSRRWALRSSASDLAVKFEDAWPALKAPTVK